MSQLKLFIDNYMMVSPEDQLEDSILKFQQLELYFYNKNRTRLLILIQQGSLPSLLSLIFKPLNASCLSPYMNTWTVP